MVGYRVSAEEPTEASTWQSVKEDQKQEEANSTMCFLSSALEAERRHEQGSTTSCRIVTFSHVHSVCSPGLFPLHFLFYNKPGSFQATSLELVAVEACDLLYFFGCCCRCLWNLGVKLANVKINSFSRLYLEAFADLLIGDRFNRRLWSRKGKAKGTEITPPHLRDLWCNPSCT